MATADELSLSVAEDVDLVDARRVVGDIFPPLSSPSALARLFAINFASCGSMIIEKKARYNFADSREKDD